MSLRWPLTGLAVGIVAGFVWGWFGGSAEKGDSALGTAFLCGLAGALAGAAVAQTGGRR
jgi:hypothetical protein